MNSLLSDSGTLEIGLGIFASAAGAFHLVFGAEPLKAGVLLALGLGLACYGVIVRWAWNKRIRNQPEERRKQRSDNPSE
jgi:hypothetical protein